MLCPSMKALRCHTLSCELTLLGGMSVGKGAATSLVFTYSPCCYHHHNPHDYHHHHQCQFCSLLEDIIRMRCWSLIISLPPPVASLGNGSGHDLDIRILFSLMRFDITGNINLTMKILIMHRRSFPVSLEGDDFPQILE